MIIDELKAHWHLSAITPVDNMTYNYVATALLNHNERVVLKIGVNKKCLFEEESAIQYFDGHGCIKLIDYSEKHSALLMQHAIPGNTLKTLYPIHADLVIGLYADTMQKLHSKPAYTADSFPLVKDWLTAIDHAPVERIPKSLLDKAISLKNELLFSSKTQRVLHGDLHHDNILHSGDEWIAIDPKGIIGEPAFEAAAFDFIHHTELTSSIDVAKLFTQRADLLAKLANIDAQRLKDWVFVRLILSAAWHIEDNGDPRSALDLATQVFSR
ncbi:MAG: aminoglycoside phosphotransferase family protein [Legionellaceae bacterium]|nr:aminoglycoside phosphotransferase family protein [Legionellaceae bacterium]